MEEFEDKDSRSRGSEANRALLSLEYAGTACSVSNIEYVLYRVFSTAHLLTVSEPCKVSDVCMCLCVYV